MEEYSERKKLVLSFNLSFLAGFIDIMGFVLAGGLFLSFMSGNSTIMVDGVVRMDGYTALRCASAIVLFVFGSFVGDLASSRFKKSIPAVLGIETAVACVVLAASFFVHEWYLFLLLAGMMGMQNSIHINISGVGLTKNFYTGTLQRIGASLSQMVQKKQNGRETRLLAFCWMSLLLGALVGGVLIGYFALPALIAFAIALLVLTLTLALRMK